MNEILRRNSDLKRVFRQGISIVAYHSGYCLLSKRIRNDYGCRILCYHSISDDPKNDYAVSKADFSKQMAYLTKHATLISIDILVNYIKAERPIPKNWFAITIDDGYKDVYTNGFEILKEYSIPATIFLPTGLIGVGSKCIRQHSLPQNDFLSWDLVREMSQYGISFGAHSVTHASLVGRTPSHIQYELESSKARLEEELGKRVAGFAYPYGTFRHINPTVERLVAKAGFDWAVTTLSGTNKLGSNPFSLRRTVIMKDDGFAGFRRAIKGSLDSWILFQRMGWILNEMHGSLK
jgi:peptidoglycan/xylan/chitin deacetylase (PgdA/CDA1 family)